MKKTILLFAVTLLSISVFSQDLATIIKKHDKAIGAEKMASFKTTRIEAVMSQMGMDITMTMYEKKPDKMRTEIEMSGMQIVTVINGDKGYMINPMMGSSEATPLDEATIAASKNQKVIGSPLNQSFKDGKMELVGETDFDGKACYKLKVIAETGTVYTYIAKKTFLVAGTEMEMTQMGQSYNTTITMADYKEVKGVKIAHKMITSAAGQNGILEFTKVEFNVPIDDSKFEIK